MTLRVEQFVQLFLKWNQRINLSAARTAADLREHVEDCEHVIPVLPTSGRVLDVGSGGGFPVVIAAMALPNTQFVSLEPVHKKHAFLRTAARELSLPNLECLAMRIEDHADRDYDAAMSRATFDLGEWIALGAARVKAGGLVIGFEAVERPDVVGERREYSVAGKRRALVLVRPS